MNIICFGDSNTYGYDPRSYFGERYSPDERWVNILSSKTGWRVLNDGMNGRMVPRQGMFVPKDTDLLIIMLGTNDLLQEKCPQEIADNMERFITETNFGNILLIAPPYLRLGKWVYDRDLIQWSVELTDLYRQLASRLGILFVDAEAWNVEILFDGVHFSEKGHRAFAEGLYQSLRCLL